MATRVAPQAKIERYAVIEALGLPTGSCGESIPPSYAIGAGIARRFGFFEAAAVLDDTPTTPPPRPVLTFARRGNLEGGCRKPPPSPFSRARDARQRRHNAPHHPGLCAGNDVRAKRKDTGPSALEMRCKQLIRTHPWFEYSPRGPWTAIGAWRRVKIGLFVTAQPPPGSPFRDAASQSSRRYTGDIYTELREAGGAPSSRDPQRP